MATLPAAASAFACRLQAVSNRIWRHRQKTQRPRASRRARPGCAALMGKEPSKFFRVQQNIAEFFRRTRLLMRSDNGCRFRLAAENPAKRLPNKLCREQHRRFA